MQYFSILSIYIYIYTSVKGSRILPFTLAAHWTRPCPQGELIDESIWMVFLRFKMKLSSTGCLIPMNQGGVRNSNAPKWLTPQSLFLTKFLWNGPLSHQVHNDRRRLSIASEVPKTIEWWNMTGGDFWNHTHLSSKFDCVPIFSFAQVAPYFLLAFCFRVRSSSKIRKRPNCKAVLMRLASITLVKQSASIMAVEIHRHCVWSLDCSLSSMTSIVVLHSWQLGTAFWVTTVSLKEIYSQQSSVQEVPA